jgi:hypothetical protein
LREISGFGPATVSSQCRRPRNTEP